MKPKQTRSIDTKKVSGFDICQTPPHALECLYPYIPQEWVLWESACGPEQLLVEALLSQGYRVCATDLLQTDRYNFFTYSPNIWDMQLTNPPFSLKYKWLQRSFELGKPFALLVPYETTAAKEFKTLFKQYNGNPWRIEKLSPERRINFKMPEMGWGISIWDEKKGKMIKKGESAQMPTCWLTWGLNIHETKHIDQVLFEYNVPMRLAKYDKNNNEL